MSGSPTNAPARARRWHGDQEKALRTRLAKKDERLATALTYPSNFGETVLGFNFYKKQREALDLCREPGSEVSIACANGGGKALALSTPILTPEGWSSMGEIRTGDHVFGADGQAYRVTYTSPIYERHECRRVIFNDGASIICDIDHLWETIRSQPICVKRKHSISQIRAVRTTREIEQTLRYGDERWGAWAHAIAPAKPILFGERWLPIAPYTLGAWLGDGTSKDPEITFHGDKRQIVQWIIEEGYPLKSERKDKRNEVRTARFEKLLPALQDNDLISNKHIPEVYFRSGKQQREALFQGLMDTDGSADEKSRCEFTSTSEQLASDVLELAIGLGHKAVINCGEAKLRGRSIGPKWRVTFRSCSGNPVFRLPSKQDRLWPADKLYYQQSGLRRIVSVEPTESVLVKCIQVESPDHCYLAGKSLIKTHNTRLLIPTLVLWHQSFFPGGVVKVTSGSYMQITEQVWPAIREHRDKFPTWKWYETPYFESQDPATGYRGFCSCFTTNEPGRAEGHHDMGPDRPLMFIIDEAKSAPEWLKGVVTGRIRPTRLVLLSSHGFAEGWFYESQTLLKKEPKTPLIKSTVANTGWGG